MADEVECVVVGAGVIGLAVARALALAGREVVLLERASAIGFETSSRNSEVIHSGIYYPKGSLKAESCVAGRRRLYAYCAEHGVAHARLGKLIVAAHDAEIPALERIAAAAQANGVDDVEWLGASAAQSLEPAVRCVAALISPSTGIIDSHALMLAYQGEAEAAGAMIVLRTPVVAGQVLAGGFELEIGGAEPGILRCWLLVNAAGLYAPALSRTIAGIPPHTIPPRLFLPRRLFHAERAFAVPAPRLSGPAGRWARCPHHPRPCQPGPLWSRCRMDSDGRLHG